MEKIKAVKAKFSMPIEEELCHSLQTDFRRMEETLREREHQLLGSNKKLQDLTYKFETAENSVHLERQHLNTRLQEIATLNDRLVQEIRYDVENDLNYAKTTLLQEVQQLEIQRNAIRNAKPNLKDQQTLEHGLKKLKYYKQLTGVRWDYTTPKGTIKGYVTNGSDYVHGFNYEAHERDANFQDLLWKEIEKATA